MHSIRAVLFALIICALGRSAFIENLQKKAFATVTITVQPSTQAGVITTSPLQVAVNPTTLMTIISTPLATSSVAATVPAAVTTNTAEETSDSTADKLLGLLADFFGFGSSSISSSVAMSVKAITSKVQESTTDLLATEASIETSSSLYFQLDSVSSSTTITSSVSSSDTSSIEIANSSGASGAAAYAAKSRGITYSPYTESDACKSAAQVAYDIDKIKDFGLIRLYSTDCSGIENVLAAMSSSQQLFLGIWEIDSASIQSELATMKQQVEGSSRGWGAVHTVSIGNELVNSGAATVAQIQTAVSQARSWFSDNATDYEGYIVSVDTLNAVVSNTGLCDISDYIAVNCHPYFTGSITPSQSGTWLESQISSVSNACGNGKTVLITETGWPTKGDSIGTCVPSEANQLIAFQSIISSVADQVISFTMYNDYWKDPGPYNIEQHWGIFGDPAA